MASCQQFRDERTGLSLFSKQIFFWTLFIFMIVYYQFLHGAWLSPNSDLFWLNSVRYGLFFALVQWKKGPGVSAFFCLLSICSFILHSIPYPHLLKCLAHQIPEHFQSLAVQNNLLFVDSYLTRLNFTLIWMLRQVSYHLFILFWAFIA